MSEHEDVLRIATSLGETWVGNSTTMLTLLRENSDGTVPALKEISHIDGIGKPGESLYAVRFAGDLAYMVTFRVTDPLYIFDLSDPLNPVQAGELQIDGYSDYLHPIGENLLLGMGKDAVPDTSSIDFGGRGAWYQGVKLALFDISNPADPRQVDSLVIGKRGTESHALYDHHALAYLPPEGDRPARLALPVELRDTMPSVPYGDPANPWFRYAWTHTGLYMFDIHTGDLPGHETGIEKRGAMIVAERPDESHDDWYWCWPTDRAVILGDSAHYVHGGEVWSATWGLGTDLVGPE